MFENEEQKNAAFEKGICWNCGEYLESEMENVGFAENPHNEIEYKCPNGCEI